MEDSSEYKVEEFDEEILREYDIRGIVKKNLNENTAYTIGRAFGHIVYNNYKKRKVIVGYDGRLTSFSLQNALCTGLSESGLNRRNYYTSNEYTLRVMMQPLFQLALK